MPEDRLPLYDDDDKHDEDDLDSEADDLDDDDDDLDEGDFTDDELNDMVTYFQQSLSGERTPPISGPLWLNQFEEMANRELKEGSSCEQVHPHVARWYEAAHESGPLESRDSILQAMACLSTEVLNSTPDEIMDGLMDNVDDDVLAGWVEYILFIGRAFERSLHKGELDDL